MSARSLIGRMALAAIAAGGLVACKPDAPSQAKPAAGSVAGGDQAAAPGDTSQAQQARPPVSSLPRRGPDGKVLETDRKKPWANGERPTRDELLARRDARRQEMLDAFDSDKDGQLSDEERLEMQESRMAVVVDKMDLDRDGKLSKAELEAMPPRGRRAPADFATLDTDQDGFVSVEEMTKNRPQRGPGGPRGGRDRGRPDDAPVTK